MRAHPSADEFEQWFRRRFGRRAFAASDEPETVHLVRRALAGEAVTPPIDLRSCTPFEAAVLRKAAEIPVLVRCMRGRTDG